MAENQRAQAANGDDRHGIIVRAAWLYYKDGLTQAEIADRLFVSRATVGRLLDAARTEGIVRFEISADHLSAFQLSHDLRDRYHLTEALVVPGIADGAGPAQINERIASAAAEYLKRFLRPGAVIGVGWGDTVMRVLFALDRDSLDGVTLASVAGGIDAYTRDSLDGVTLASVAGGIDAYTREVTARNTNGVNEHLRIIPAPLVASSAKIATALREDQSVTGVLRLAESAVATLTGIGASRPGASSVRSGLATDEQLRSFRDLGVVGDMLGEWYDRDGRIIYEAASDRRIGMSIDRLRQMPNVIGVAGGTEKIDAIAGAVRGGYLDVLVTDEDVAEALLAL